MRSRPYLASQAEGECAACCHLAGSTLLVQQLSDDQTFSDAPPNGQDMMNHTYWHTGRMPSTICLDAASLWQAKRPQQLWRKVTSPFSATAADCISSAQAGKHATSLL